MLTEQTLQQLQSLNLLEMARKWQEQQRDPQMAELSFDERFGLLVESEHLARDNRRLQRRLKEAELRIAEACLEDVATSSARGIEKATVHQLATCAWVDQHRNVLITGMTGVGKPSATIV